MYSHNKDHTVGTSTQLQAILCQHQLCVFKCNSTYLEIRVPPHRLRTQSPLVSLIPSFRSQPQAPVYLICVLDWLARIEQGSHPSSSGLTFCVAHRIHETHVIGFIVKNITKDSDGVKYRVKCAGKGTELPALCMYTSLLELPHLDIWKLWSLHRNLQRPHCIGAMEAKITTQKYDWTKDYDVMVIDGEGNPTKSQLIHSYSSFIWMESKICVS